MLAGVTYLIRDWVTMGMVTSIPFLLYYGYILVLPESPRWLLAKGRYEEALKVLEEMARVNQKELPDSFRRALELRVRRGKLRTKTTKTNTFGTMDLCKYDQCLKYNCYINSYKISK